MQVGSEVEYEVARVVGHRRRGRGLQYLVEWVGYDTSEATWEPESHLAHASRKIAAYWASRGDCGAAWLSAPDEDSDFASSLGSSFSDLVEGPRRPRFIPST